MREQGWRVPRLSGGIQGSLTDDTFESVPGHSGRFLGFTGPRLVFWGSLVSLGP